MKTLSAKDAKYGFGPLIDLARAEPVAVAKHGRPVVVVMAVEEYVRLKSLRQATSIAAQAHREDRMMDRAIHNKIVSFIRGFDANLGSRSHLTPDSQTLSADAKRSESPGWR